MKSKKAILPLIVLCLLMTLLGCEDDPCDSYDYPANEVKSIILLESGTELPLIGKNSLYHPDTIEALNDGRFTRSAVSENFVEFNYVHSRDQEELIFHLSATEQDTIWASYEVRRGECFDRKTMTAFKYNGESMEMAHTFAIYK